MMPNNIGHLKQPVCKKMKNKIQTIRALEKERVVEYEEYNFWIKMNCEEVRYNCKPFIRNEENMTGCV